MKCLICPVLCLAALAAAPPVPERNPEATPPLPDDATVAAVKKLSGNIALLVRDEWGYPDLAVVGRKRGRGGLPCFTFSCWQATDSTLSDLPRIRVPFGLEARNSEVTEAGLKRLATQPALRHLGFDNGLVRIKLGEGGLRRIGDLTGLESLDLRDVGTTDAGLGHIARLKKLRHLRVSEVMRVSEVKRRFGDGGVAHLARLKALETLCLNGGNVTDTGLAHLAGLTNLRHLSLLDCQVTDAGLKHLTGLRRLRSLELVNAKVTDAGLKHLVGLKDLRRISLFDTRVTDEGVARLRKALPKLNVER